MNKYIDAEWLKQNLNLSFWSEINKIIDNAPNIDIVHCKECKFGKMYQADSRGKAARVCEAYRHTRLVSDDDFCSDGERVEVR